MDSAAQPFVGRTSADIHAETRGERCKCRIGTAERSCHDTDGEEYDNGGSQISRCREHRKQFVARCRQRHALAASQHHEQYTEREKQQIGR